MLQITKRYGFVVLVYLLLTFILSYYTNYRKGSANYLLDIILYSAGYAAVILCALNLWITRPKQTEAQLLHVESVNDVLGVLGLSTLAAYYLYYIAVNLSNPFWMILRTNLPYFFPAFVITAILLLLIVKFIEKQVVGNSTYASYSKIRGWIIASMLSVYLIENLIEKYAIWINWYQTSPLYLPPTALVAALIIIVTVPAFIIKNLI